MPAELIWDFIKKFGPVVAAILVVVAIWFSGDSHGKRVVQQKWDQQTARLAVAEANRLHDQAVRDKQADDALAMAASQIALLRDQPVPRLMCRAAPVAVPPGQPAAPGSSPAGTGSLPEAFELDTKSLKEDAYECDSIVEQFRAVLRKWPR